MSSRAFVKNILEKLKSHDKDFRYMAVNDFEAKLRSSKLMLDGELERQVCIALVSLLEDKSPDVQGRAVICLHAMAERVSGGSLLQMCTKLLALCTKEREAEKRDIACVGLKNVIRSVGSEHGSLMVSQCTPVLVSVFQNDQGNSSVQDQNIQADALDVLAELIHRFGPLMHEEHAKLMKLMLSQLTGSVRSASRKRAIQCLSYLAVVVGDDLLSDLVHQLSDPIEKTPSLGDKKSLVQALGSIAKAIGRRLGPYLHTIVPILERSISLGHAEKMDANDDEHQSMNPENELSLDLDETVELKEHCFQVLETVCSRCVKDAAPHVDRVVDLAMRYLTFDPNYAGSDDEDDGDTDMNDAFGDDGFGSAGDEEVDDMDVEGGDEGDDEWGAAFGSDDEEFDIADIEDDDMSWKVRKSCARLLGVVVQTRPDRLSDWLKSIAKPLVSRFAEREENVRMDVFASYTQLLRSTAGQLRAASAIGGIETLENMKSLHGSSEESSQASPAAAAAVVNVADSPTEGKIAQEAAAPSSPVVGMKVALRELTPKTISALLGQLPKAVGGTQVVNKNALSKRLSAAGKTREAVFGVLKEMCEVKNVYSPEDVSAVVPAIVAGLSLSNAPPLQLVVLQLLRSLLVSHPASHFHAHFSALCEPVCELVGAAGAKQVAADALRVHSALVQCMRVGDFDYSPFVSSLYQAAMTKLSASEVDQEIKECAIGCMANLVSHIGDKLDQGEIKEVLQLFMVRLENEVTRLAAVRAVACLANSSLPMDICSSLSTLLPLLSSFLRKAHRPLKDSSLQALIALVRRCRAHKSVKRAYHVIFKEVTPLLSDADLHLCQLALQLIVACLKSASRKSSSSVVEAIRPQIYPTLLRLVPSPLMQGQAQEALLCLFASLAESDLTGLEAKTLMKDLLQLGHSGDRGGGGSSSSVATGNKQSLPGIARCVAAVAEKGGESRRVSTVAHFISQATTTGSSKDAHHGKSEKSASGGSGKDVMQRVLALHCLGEIGRRCDLSAEEKVLSALLNNFDVAEEEVKVAAYRALGGVTAGAPKAYIPALLKQLESNPQHRYLLLHSINELIQLMYRDTPQALIPFADTLSTALFAETTAEEEGTRNVVSECLGRLALVQPAVLLPKFVDRLSAEESSVRAVVVSALKFSILDQPHPIDAYLHADMQKFMSLLEDKDIVVRRCALLSLTFAAHHKPALVWPHLRSLLPLVYGETSVREDLLQAVDFGPFKYTTDLGLPLRKSAFECMFALLEHSAAYLVIEEFIVHVAKGLRDVFEIKMLCHLILIRMIHGAQISFHLVDNLGVVLPALRSTLQTTLKESAVKQEVERNEQQIRSALRVIASLSFVSSANKHPKFLEFLQSTILNHPKLSAAYAQICEDVNGAVGSSDHFRLDVSTLASTASYKPQASY